ncbi:hypothetical protein [Haladaptatus sp. NG-WS-4]
MNDDPHYREVQRFRQGWLWAFLLVTNVPVGLLVAVIIVDESGGFTREAVTTIVLVVFALVLPLVAIHRAALVTEVRDDGLYCKFFPFHLRYRHVRFDAMTHVESTSYSPIRDYGGWGVRLGVSLSRRGLTWDEKGMAYVVSGARGVRIERTDARPLLVGSQRADELRRAIDARR